ncbi:MAG: hypothetical protein O2V44_10605 [Candidatus Bathyarchaeota archaeon]|nr:hypothetical protein [Candidatus Bathyarchaeota archaeon]
MLFGPFSVCPHTHALTSDIEEIEDFVLQNLYKTREKRFFGKNGKFLGYFMVEIVIFTTVCFPVTLLEFDISC